MSHRAKFFFRTHGAECGGTQWIYDGDEPIALLERRTIDQPEQILRYFNLVPRPINLRHLILRPGGRPLVSGVPMYWKLTPDIITAELARLDVEGQGTERLQVTLVTRDRWGLTGALRVVTVTYDSEIESYVYDFECHLDIHSPEPLAKEETASFEYSDPWYVDIPGPGIEFPGMWEKRPFTHLLCERPDGTVHKMPLNHAGFSGIGSSLVRPGGILLPVFDPGNNPAIEFVGETALQSRIGVCPWGYDIHLCADVRREELWGPIFRQFRIFCCPDERARELMDAAEPVPEIERDGMTVLPLYERHTSFEEPCRLSEPPGGATDAWSWMPEGDGCAYEQEFGRSDDYSLKIHRSASGISLWKIEYEGEGGFMEPWPDWTGLRVTGLVMTEDVAGRGACIALCWERYNQAKTYPHVYSQRLAGSTDWKEVSVELYGRHPEDCNAVMIAMMLDGDGTVWFDDVDVVRISDDA